MTTLKASLRRNADVRSDDVSRRSVENGIALVLLLLRTDNFNPQADLRHFVEVDALVDDDDNNALGGALSGVPYEYGMRYPANSWRPRRRPCYLALALAWPYHQQDPC